MRINFYAENRMKVTTSKEVEIVGSYEPEEILIVEKWREATEVTFKFYAPISWARQKLLQNNAPKTKGLYVAKYIGFKNVYDNFDYYIIDSVKTEDNGKNNDAMITVKAYSWQKMFEKMPNLIGNKLKDLQEKNGGTLNVKTVFNEISKFYGENSPYSFLQIPVKNMESPFPDYTQEHYFTKWGYINNNDTINGDVEIEDFNVGTVKELLDEIYQKIPDYEITTFNFGTENNIQSKWAVRKQITDNIIFSEEKGDLKIEGFSLEGENEVFAYDPKKNIWSFTGGDTPLNEQLTGSWLSSRSIEVEVPDDIIDPKKFLKNAARKEKNKDNNISVFGRVFMLTNKMTLKTGVKVGLRIGDDVIYRPITEVATSFGKNTGWKKEGIFEINTNELLTTTEDERKIYYPKEDDGDFGVVSVNNKGFFIPYTNSENNGEPPTTYDWKIYWNGRLYGRFSGVTNNLKNQGIFIPPEEFVPGLVNRLVITPGDGVYRTGWMRAYSFRRIDDEYKTITDIHQVTNLRKYMLTDEDTGPNFLREQYAGCKLIGSRVGEETTYGTIVPETEYINSSYPSTTKIIRDGAEYRRFADNINSNYHVKESWSPALQRVGNNYAVERFKNCKTVDIEETQTYTPNLETVGDNFKQNEFSQDNNYTGDNGRISILTWGTPHTIKLGNYYREYQFRDNKHITDMISETGSDRIESIGSNFQYGMFDDSSITSHIGTEADFPNCSKIGEYWRYQMYNNCTQLKTAQNEKMPQKIKSVSHYRRAVFNGCTSLTTTVEEDTSQTLTNIGTWFRLREYDGCINLTTATKEANIQTVTNIGEGYREQRFIDCPSLENTAIEGKLKEGVIIEGDFRRGEYKNSLTLNAAVSPEVLLTDANIHSSYRAEQFYNSGAKQWQEENTKVSVLDNSGSNNFRENQYYNSKVSIPDGATKSDHISRSFSISSRTITGYRENQFYGCTNVIRTLRENMATVETSYSWSRYESGMYRNCINLETIYPEFKLVPYSSPSGILDFYNYMMNKFNGCVSLSPASVISLQIDDGILDISGSRSFRSNMFANSSLDVNNPIRYINGDSVIPGENNIPLDFYGV